VSKPSANLAQQQREQAQAALADLLAPFRDPRDEADLAEWFMWHSAVRDLPRLLLIDCRESVKALIVMTMIVPDDSWLPFSLPMPGFHHAQMEGLRFEHLSPQLQQLALETIVVVKRHLHGTPHAGTFQPNATLIELMKRLPEDERNRAFSHYDLSTFLAFEELMLHDGVPHYLQHQAYIYMGPGDRYVRVFAMLVWRLVREPKLPCSADDFAMIVDHLFTEAVPGTLHQFFSDTLAAILDIVTDYEAGAHIVRRLLSGELACPDGSMHGRGVERGIGVFTVDVDYCGRLSVENDAGLLLVWKLRQRYAEEPDIMAGLAPLIARVNGAPSADAEPALTKRRAAIAALCRR
jgi:hypothetical protein